MSERNTEKKLINTTFNYNPKKLDVLSPYHTTKMETVSQKNADAKKFYLPSIRKRAIPRYPISSMKLVKSKSQGKLDISNEIIKPQCIKPNCIKEKLMVAKLSLSRIESRINEMIFDCQKLKNERIENLKMIKEIINSNNTPDKEILISKIHLALENSNYNKKTFSTENYESYKYTLEEKNEDLKGKDNGKLKIYESRINNLKDNKKHTKEKEVKIEEFNKNIINEENEEDKNKEDNQNNENNNKIEKGKNKEENQNIEDNNIFNTKGMIEEIKNNENNVTNNIDSKNKKSDDLNQEISNTPDFSAENMIKINAISGNNSNFNNIMNNSLDENLKEIIEEERDEDFNQKENSGIFGKSFVPKKVYNKAKIQKELLILKHKIINIQQQIRLKDEEIEEIKNRASMKSLIFKSSMLNTKMVKLYKIRTKNDKIEKSSIPRKNIEKGNLKNELDYYTKKNRSFISENKSVEESYNKVKNEYEDINKIYSDLEIKNDRLKYRYNSLRLKDIKKQIELDNLKRKISQIETMRLMVENNIQIIEGKKKDIEETKKILEERTKECKRTKENCEKKYQEMNKFQKDFTNNINKQKNEIIRKQKEIKQIDKIILQEIDKYQHLTKNNKKFINMNYIYNIKTIPEFLNFLNELEKDIIRASSENKITKFENLQKGGKFNFFRIAKIKNKIIKLEEINFLEEKPEPKPEQNLEYYINSNGELVLKNQEKKDENNS